MRATILTIVVLLGFLAAASGIAWWVWTELADVAMSWQGYLALAAGAAATLALGIGLMSLLFYSNRKGFDDDVW